MHHHPAKKTNGPDQDVGAEPSWTFPEEQDAERPALVGEARDPSWPSSFLAFSSLPKGRHTEKPLLHTPGSFCSPCSLPAAPSTALSKNMAEKWEGPKIASHSRLHELQIPRQNHFSSKRRKEIHLQSPPKIRQSFKCLCLVPGNFSIPFLWPQTVFIYSSVSSMASAASSIQPHHSGQSNMLLNEHFSPLILNTTQLSHAGLHVLLGQEIQYLLPWYFCKRCKLLSQAYRKYIHTSGFMVFMYIYTPNTKI